MFDMAQLGTFPDAGSCDDLGHARRTPETRLKFLAYWSQYAQLGRRQ